MRFLLVLIALWLAPHALAVDCAAVFARLFYEHDFYHETECALNSHKLVNRLIEEGTPAEKIHVVYFLYEQYRGDAVPILYKTDLTPHASRLGPLRYTWGRHVVVEVDGKIYDMDHRPEPVPAREYMARMFPSSFRNPKGGLEDHIYLRRVPAKRNRDEFWYKGGDHNAVVDVLGPREDNVPGLPVQVARDWLNQIDPK